MEGDVDILVDHRRGWGESRSREMKSECYFVLSSQFFFILSFMMIAHSSPGPRDFFADGCGPGLGA